MILLNYVPDFKLPLDYLFSFRLDFDSLKILISFAFSKSAKSPQRDKYRFRDRSSPYIHQLL